jgi:hypothetical protein
MTNTEIREMTNEALLDAARKTLHAMEYQNGRWDKFSLIDSAYARRMKRQAVRVRSQHFDRYCDICDELQRRGIADDFEDWEAVASNARSEGRNS